MLFPLWLPVGLKQFREAVSEVSSMAAGVTVIIVLFTCFVCCTGSSMGIVSWLLLPKALKSTYSKSKALSGRLLSMYRF